ncbi:MAG TPA: sigma-70 family RNA polymerase sigma factor [Stellaceae bacterium]|nr:sigma-70 family RNA polymerase sigma factor [Stellaceae bacterium]
MMRAEFEAVVLPHLDAAYNLARWLTRNPADADDVVQEAVLRAATYFAGFRGTNARAWLLQIVRNTAYASRALVRGAVAVPLPGDERDGPAAPELVDPGDDPEIAFSKREDRTRLTRLLAALPVELRETLVLREIEELAYKEIAQITQAPIGTVMSRLWRARQMLAAAVQGEEGR